MSASQTFRASPGSYAMLCGVLSLPFLIWAGAALSGHGVDVAALLISMALPATAAIWLASFRLRFDDSGIDYRDLFGKSFRVAYSEIAFLKSRTISTGRGFSYEWLLHLHDGRRLRVNFKPFPREMKDVLCRRIRCDC